MTSSKGTRLVPVPINRGTTIVPSSGIRVLDNAPQPAKPRRDRYGRFLTIAKEARHEHD